MLTRLFLLCALCCAIPLLSWSQQPAPSAGESKSNPPQTEPNSTQNKSRPDKRGTSESPLIVKLLNTGRSREETDRDQQHEKAEAETNGWTLWLTGLLAVGTFLVFGVGFWQARITRNAIRDQAQANERTIGQATRTADAMTALAEAMTSNVESVKRTVEINREIADRQKQLIELQFRPYVAAIVGGRAIYQDRPNNLRFEGGISLQIIGSSPAHKVRHRIRAGVFPAPLPPPSDLHLLLPDVTSDEGFIPPLVPARQISDVVPIYYDDASVADIKAGRGQALYVWGTITYEDVFSAPHETRFCIMIIWRPPKDDLVGFYIPSRNSMT